MMVAMGCGMGDQHMLWQELDAPGGKLRIEYDEPPAFGSHTLYFSYRAGGTEEWQALDTLDFNNDGANLGEHNLKVTERGADEMLLLLRGQQQKEVGLRLSVLDGKAKLNPKTPE
jgi:hypothetical protein